MNHTRSVHLLVQGKVQGVFFRATAKEMAESLDLKGWVKNTPAGEVEIMACGNREKVQEFIDWCKKGPSRAFVTAVQVTDSENYAFDSFQVIRY
ncbi:MAG TPA: acylphosphatase [Flavisolibacter sp.]|nr:acylphosphatase [Flavisolibacter sp.]